MNWSNPYIARACANLYPQVAGVDGEIGAVDAQGNIVQVDDAKVQAEALVLEEEAQKQNCKKQASELLYETDWTTIPDVADPSNSPYLANQADFIAYRNAVRKLAVNPEVNPVFPTKPQEVWA